MVCDRAFVCMELVVGVVRLQGMRYSLSLKEIVTSTVAVNGRLGLKAESLLSRWA